MVQNSIIYQDIPLDFKAHPVTGRISLLKNEKSIAQSIKNLVLTNKYEVLFNSSVYSDVSDSLFELMDSGDIALLKNKIEILLKYNEERVTVLDVTYKDDINNNGFFLYIKYIAKNALEPNTVPIFLERVR